jgi:hypothetical protein
MDYGLLGCNADYKLALLFWQASSKLKYLYILNMELMGSYKMLLNIYKTLQEYKNTAIHIFTNVKASKSHTRVITFLFAYLISVLTLNFHYVIKNLDSS